MPVYDYKCNDCGLKFEKSLKMAESDSTECPVCKTNTSNKLPAKGVMGKVGEPTHIPKDIDLAVGRSAEERWQAYEDRAKRKQKVRDESDTKLVTRDPDGNYAPLAIQKDGKTVNSKEALKVRRDMYDTMDTIKKDSKTEKFVNEEQ